MPNSFDEIARRAAQRLSADLDRKLPGTVEARLQAGGRAPERYEPATVIALAALVLNVANLRGHLSRSQERRGSRPVG
jgi:hypothetical protein